MAPNLLRKVTTGLKHLPSLIQGYNLYVNPEKLRLIEHTLGTIMPQARSFADLGGVWNVNAAYCIHSLRRFPHLNGVLVDTDIPPALESQLGAFPNLRVIHGDFGQKETIEAIGNVDVVYFFDVLLHQANPDWNEILSRYAPHVQCMVIYNQQLVGSEKTVRLTQLPLDEYIRVTGGRRTEVFEYIFSHRDEIHPVYKKPWGDIHNVTQWGITDNDLRSVMASLGFHEAYYRNFGRFVGLDSLENHAFVFTR